MTPLDINSEVRDVQYQSACVSENQTKVYNCAYVGDTLSSWIVGAERFISSTSNAIPYADGSITLIGTTQSGLGTISHFRVSNAGPSIYYGEVDTRVDPASPNYGFVAPSFADGPCQVGCVFRLGAGYSMDFDVRTVPYFYRSTDGSLVIPQGNRYCSFVEIRALDVGAGLHTTSADADTSNNHAPCFSGDVQVTVTPGTSSPRNQTVASGSANVPMLQFALNPPSPTTLDNITLTASGTGNEQVDVTAVRLYVDGNSNGTVDAGDTAIASGTFGANDGTVTLAVTPPYGVSGPTSFLVTYDFNVTIASRFGGAIMLAGLLPLILVPRKRRRGIVGLLLLVGAFGITGLGLGACGGDSTSPNPNPGGSATYTVQLTGATAGGSAISGVSVQGATVTIAK